MKTKNHFDLGYSQEVLRSPNPVAQKNTDIWTRINEPKKGEKKKLWVLPKLENWRLKLRDLRAICLSVKLTNIWVIQDLHDPHFPK